MSVSEVKGKQTNHAQEAKQKREEVEKPAPKKHEEPKHEESNRPALAKA